MNFFESTNIHENSAKMYNNKLNEWISYMPNIYKSLACIIMFPEISMKELQSHLKVNTNTNRHIFIVAIMSFIKHKHSELQLTHEQYSTIRVKWIDINNENEQPIIDRRLENKPTDKQTEKGGSKISFNQIIAKRDELPVGSIERLLICMYTMIPPARADYFATQIVKDDEVSSEKNYIRVRGNNMECILTDFKTVKTYKKITHVFPIELVSELNASLKIKPRNYLFLNANGDAHTRNSFVLWARRCLSRIFETDFTLVFFRHSFVTNYMSTVDATTTDGQIKDISDKLGHSPEMFRAYKWIKGQD